MRHCWLVLLLVLCLDAQAHRYAPASLQLDELQNGLVAVRWKVPLQSVSSTPLTPRFPSACRRQSVSPWFTEGTGQLRQYTFDCSDSELIGQRLSVEGLGENQATAVLQVSLLDGAQHQVVLTANNPGFRIPPLPSSAEIMPRYSLLGMEHIWGGIDHLLFVLGLFLLVTGGRRLIATVTAFTVGHSVTLAAVTLGVVDYPVALVEFLIAASIFLLACELSRTEGTSPLWQKPWRLAAVFGLLHGMGFAGALAETGLPQNNIPLALLFFNVGIELGQVVFIVALLVLGRLAATQWRGTSQPARQLTILVLGVASAQWSIERGLLALG